MEAYGKKREPKGCLAIASFVIAILLVVVNMCMPPPGKVDESIIYVFAQLLLYSATLLGVQLLLQEHGKNAMAPNERHGCVAT